MLARKSVMTVNELLATVDLSKLSPREPRSRVVVMAIEAGARAASAEVIVTRPKNYAPRQLAFRSHNTA